MSRLSLLIPILMLLACAATQEIVPVPEVPDEVPAEVPAEALDAVATVGRVPITRIQVERMMAGLEEPGLSRSQLQQEAIDQLIAEELLYQEAQRRGFQPTEAQISGQLDLLAREFLSGSEFEDKLREHDLDEAHLRRQLGRELAIARLLDVEVYAKTVVGDAETVKRPREVHELSIFRRIYTDAPQRARQEAWEMMRMAREKLLAGADFGEVAKEFSQSALAKYGGDAGFVAFNPTSEVSRILFGLKEGQISEIIETQEGLFILKAEEIRPERTQAFGELNPELKRTVFQRRLRERLDDFVEELRQRADVHMAS
jgi:bifunctional DNA-binding transcriptional regulator/antitoxin component of YhaV-PrlF toxin-antitoxin module